MAEPFELGDEAFGDAFGVAFAEVVAGAIVSGLSWHWVFWLNGCRPRVWGNVGRA